MQPITMTNGLWAMANPIAFARQHLEAPLQVWTPPRWPGMSQADAGIWWTTVPVPVPDGQTLHSLEDYRALLVWLLEMKQRQYIQDLQTEALSEAQAVEQTLAEIRTVMPPDLPGPIEPTIETLINFQYDPLRRAIFPEGLNCFPVRPEAMVNGTMVAVGDCWNFTSWLNQYQTAVTGRE